MNDKLDNINIGEFYTENYLKNTGVIGSPSWESLYSPRYRPDKSAQDSGVINDGDSDTSDVFEISAMYSSTGLDISIQDQSSEIIDLYLCKTNGTTNASDNISIDDEVITVDDTTGAVVGECINISENGRVMQAIVQSITGNDIGFNTPSEQAFTTAAVVCFGSWNMNVNASTASPQVFKICPPTGVKWDITRVIFGISDQSAMDDSKFGGIPALTNGVVLRVRDGIVKNIFVVTDNGGFRERSFDIEYADKAPAGFYGFGCRRTFGGQSKNGVVVRLDGSSDDELQIYIQDDLTDLDKFACVAQGHKVE